MKGRPNAADEEISMTKAGRVIAMVLALSLTSGALAPLAHAQQPSARAPMMQEQLKTGPGVDQVIISDEVRAGVVNAFRVPGKAFTCAIGSGLALAVLAVSFGSLHKAANGVVDESCRGKWVLSAADMTRDREVSRAFDWETHRFDWEPR
jgi:hypothetical protein